MYTVETHPTLAIDYDGTIITEGNFPNKGPFKEGAIETLIDMQKAGYKLNIWTCREGYNERYGMTQEELVMDSLKGTGLDVDNIFFNVHFDHYKETFPDRGPKIYADVYIDDRAVGVGKIDWKKIRPLFKDLPQSDVIEVARPKTDIGTYYGGVNHGD